MEYIYRCFSSMKLVLIFIIPTGFKNGRSLEKMQNKSSPREKSALRKSQSKRSAQRKTSPLGWFPRRKGDSYLNRKIKKLQVKVSFQLYNKMSLYRFWIMEDGVCV